MTQTNFSTTKITNNQSRIAIIQFPGSNCETESMYAINKAGMLAEEFLWNRSVDELEDFDGYFIIGGFSYEDRSRSGVISAKDALMDGIIYQARKGKPVLGICNGAQVLIESGLVPALKELKLGGALAVNKREQDGKILGTGFYSTWVNMKANPQSKNLFTKNFTADEILHLPIAHGEGRFVIPAEVLEVMKKNGQLLFQYCDEQGNILDTFPTNPNGSVANLSAIGNPSGNVMAMMPHPERAIDKPDLSSQLCAKIFENMRVYIETNKVDDYDTFVWNELEIELKNHTHTYRPKGQQVLVQSVITDKEAITINQTLANLGVKATVSKLTHWEIVGGDLSKILASEELHNPNKENILESLPNPKTQNILVRYNDDFVGVDKKTNLAHSGIAVESISKGLIWQVEGDLEGVLASNILANPFGQTVYLMGESKEIKPNNTVSKKDMEIKTLENRFKIYQIAVFIVLGLEFIFTILDILYGYIFTQSDYIFNFNFAFFSVIFGLVFFVFLIGAIFEAIIELMWLHHAYGLYIKYNQTSEENPRKTRKLTATGAVWANFIPFVNFVEPYLNLNEMLHNNNNKSSFSLNNFDTQILVLWALNAIGLVYIFFGNNNSSQSLALEIIILVISLISTVLSLTIRKRITTQQVEMLKNLDNA
jgi:phosphoribosylformylglycinamidine synthase subunit PurQ / glutaminase